MELVIFGVGETASMAFEYFSKDSDYDVIGFCADSKYIESELFCGLKTHSFEDFLAIYDPGSVCVFVAISFGKMNEDRKIIFEKLDDLGFDFATYISSHSFVWDTATIGRNCFILEDNTIQHGVKIGDNVTLWSGNHIGHQSEIRPHCFISSHVVISGFCFVGESSMLGVNSSIADEIRIASRTVVGMGSVIHKNIVDPDGTYVGVPARRIR